MQLESRIKRLQELAGWFNARYQTRIELNGRINLGRLVSMTNMLKAMVVACKPQCYYCQCDIKVSDIEVDEDEITIHHADQNRQNNQIENLLCCHRSCHQTLHKLAISAGVPTLILMAKRELKCNQK